MIGALLAATLFITNERSGTVSAIDTRTEKVIATQHAGTRARGIVSDGKRLYVAISHFKGQLQHDPDGVVAIDPKTLKIVRRYECGRDPEGIALTPDKKHFVVSNEDAGTATIVDIASGKQTSLVTGTEPEGVAASPDGKWIYITAETSSTVTVIDARKNTVVANFFVSARPRGALFSADSKRAWVTSEIGGAIDVVDVPHHRVIAKIQLPKNDHPVGLVERGGRLYVATGRGNSVAVIERDKLINQIPVGSRPWWLGFAEGKLYVANGLSNDISIIEDDRVVGTIKAGDGPWGVTTTSED
ncbi:MAG TPA: PQQ-dependent catabolism-associated beta-propeller protein [Thermoanaerobaculia bacterium]|jgi:YVTN family beta-propeller protein|nr:PQQ-dependent catabolism-associated beta-propeller protein [Thermoanaerobaculia bacterium]